MEPVISAHRHQILAGRRSSVIGMFLIRFPALIRKRVRRDSAS
jgi:hypothetical protein